MAQGESGWKRVKQVHKGKKDYDRRLFKKFKHED
jgi:hypothetical protein